MEKIKEHSSVLIISDYYDRSNFIQNYLMWHFLFPVWHSNIGVMRKAITKNTFSMVIIDLSLPIDPKIELAKKAYSYQPDVIIMTIGKLSFLNSTNVLSYIPKLFSIDSINSFPDKLEILTGKKIYFQNAGFNTYGSEAHTLH